MNPTLAKAAANLKRRAESRLPAVWLSRLAVVLGLGGGLLALVPLG